MDIPQTGYAVMARRLPPPNVAAGIQEAGWRAMQGQAGGQCRVRLAGKRVASDVGSVGSEATRTAPATQWSFRRPRGRAGKLVAQQEDEVPDAHPLDCPRADEAPLHPDHRPPCSRSTVPLTTSRLARSALKRQRP